MTDESVKKELLLNAFEKKLDIILSYLVNNIQLTLNVF